jgi:hypothetical protein
MSREQIVKPSIFRTPFVRRLTRDEGTARRLSPVSGRRHPVNAEPTKQLVAAIASRYASGSPRRARKNVDGIVTGAEPVRHPSAFGSASRSRATSFSAIVSGG